MKKYLAILALTLCATANAAVVYKGKIKRIQPMKNGTVLVVIYTASPQQESVSGTRPGCHNGFTGFAIDTNTVAGRAMHANLTASMLRDESVRLNGDGTCLPSAGTTPLNVEQLDSSEVGDLS